MERQNTCKNCYQWFFYQTTYYNGRLREYCDNCDKMVKQKLARDRKRAERLRKANDQGKPEPRLLGGGEEGSGEGGTGLSPLPLTTEFESAVVRQFREFCVAINSEYYQREQLWRTAIR